MKINKENLATYGDRNHSSFITHLEAKTESVRTWPTWKQNLLGDALPAEKSIDGKQKTGR